MKVHSITVHLNASPDGKNFWSGHKAGDPMENVGTWQILAEDEIAAAEIMFRLGNLRDITDRNGQGYPNTARSISVGDVLVIEDGDTTNTLKCASFGWNPTEL
jgi:hypothetical protein